MRYLGICIPERVNWYMGVIVRHVLAPNIDPTLVLALFRSL